jgi:hypothetical protein
VLGTKGVFLKWVWHRPGQKNGLIGIKTPRELSGTKNGKGGNKTQAVVVYLVDLLPPSLAPYHVYLDNLFTCTKLLELLRKKRYIATGTCRTTSSVLSKLVELKKKDNVTNVTRDPGTLGSDALGRQENPGEQVSYVRIHWSRTGPPRVGNIPINLLYYIIRINN